MAISAFFLTKYLNLSILIYNTGYTNIQIKEFRMFQHGQLKLNIDKPTCTFHNLTDSHASDMTYNDIQHAFTALPKSGWELCGVVPIIIERINQDSAISHSQMYYFKRQLIMHGILLVDYTKPSIEFRIIGTTESRDFQTVNEAIAALQLDGWQVAASSADSYTVTLIGLHHGSIDKARSTFIFVK